MVEGGNKMEPTEVIYYMKIAGAVLISLLILWLLFRPKREDWSAFDNRQQIDEHGKWLPGEYALRLSWFEKEKCEQMSRKEAVAAEHPDFDKRSPNYIDVDSIGKGDFWRELNIVYYKTFPELVDEHGWDMKRMQYKNRNGEK